MLGFGILHFAFYLMKTIFKSAVILDLPRVIQYFQKSSVTWNLKCAAIVKKLAPILLPSNQGPHKSWYANYEIENLRILIREV